MVLRATKSDVAVLACYEKERAEACPEEECYENDVAVLACYEKERVEACPEESARMLRKRAWRGRVQKRVLACYEKVTRPCAVGASCAVGAPQVFSALGACAP